MCPARRKALDRSLFATDTTRFVMASKDTEAGEFLPTPAKDHNASHKRVRAERAGSPSAARRSMSASPSTSPPRSRAGRSPTRETPRTGDDDREENAGTIFVGNLNHETTERRLREYFETYGRVLSTKVCFAITVECCTLATLILS